MDTKILPILVSLLLIPGLAVAQQGIVAGTVVDAKTGETLPGVNVVIAETQQGAATDAEGEFRLTGVGPGEYTLRATFVGYQPAERTVSVSAESTTQVRIRLQPGAVELREVAVTALGLEQSRDELGTAQSNIDAQQLENTGESSVLKSLSGKAAGLTVTGFGGDPGAGARITIRGAKTIQGDSQPLIIIDGTPIYNSTITQGSNQLAGVQQQSRLNDLNPEVIKSIEVLKGASAAALWGSRAQNGAIVIETKSGQYGQDTEVSFETTVGANELNKTQNLQESYGQGFGGRYFQGTSLSWGDRVSTRAGGEDLEVTESGQFFFDPNGAADRFSGVAVGQQSGRIYGSIPSGFAPVFNANGNQIVSTANPHGGKRSKETVDHGSSLFENGLTFENSISVSGGSEVSSFFLNVGHTREEGIAPVSSNYERTTIKLSGERSVNEKLTVSADANYVRTASDRAQQGSNLSGILLGGYRTAAGFDNSTDWLVDYYPNGLDGTVVEEGKHRSYRNPLGSGTAGYPNPYFTLNENKNTSLVDRLFGKVETSYDVFSWFNLTGRVGVDTYRDRRDRFFALESASQPSGHNEEEIYNEYQVNVDVLGRASRSLTDAVDLSATVGFNYNRREFDNVSGEVQNFSNPVNVRSVTNGASSDIDAFTNQQVEVTASVYGELNLDFYDQLFISGTGRVDQASTFGPEADDTFFYPSGSIAWQFTEAIGEQSILSFGKLRASAGIVGRQPNPYQSTTDYEVSSFADGYGPILDASGYGGGYQRDESLGNTLIEPEKTVNYEGGADLRFLDDRVSLSGTYYFERTTNAIFPVSVAPASGFAVRTSNAAEIENKGVELELSAQWPEVNGFSWETRGTFTANQNEVVDLAGVKEYGLNGFAGTSSSLIEGEPVGVIFGARYRRAPDGCSPGNTPTQPCEPLTQQEKNKGWSKGEDGLVLNAEGFPVQASTPGKLGDPNPDWTAGVGNTFEYAGFTLDVLFDFSIGRDVWNGTKGALYFFGRHADQGVTTTLSAERANNLVRADGTTVADAVDSSTLPTTWANDDGSYTVRGKVKDFGGGEVFVDEAWWTGTGNGFFGPDEPFVEDGSYARLREVQLSYNWDSGFVQEIGLSRVNVSLVGRNLWTATPYDGIDPETNLTGPTNGQGLDYFNNPNTRNYQFSLRLVY